MNLGGAKRGLNRPPQETEKGLSLGDSHNDGSGCGKFQNFWTEPGVVHNFGTIGYGRIVGYRYH